MFLDRRLGRAHYAISPFSFLLIRQGVLNDGWGLLARRRDRWWTARRKMFTNKKNAHDWRPSKGTTMDFGARLILSYIVIYALITQPDNSGSCISRSAMHEPRGRVDPPKHAFDRRNIRQIISFAYPESNIIYELQHETRIVQQNRRSFVAMYAREREREMIGKLRDGDFNDFCM